MQPLPCTCIIYISRGIHHYLSCTGNTPGTLAIGAIFNSNCMHWEDKCGSDGACLALDVERTALELTVVVIAVKLVSQIFVTTAYFLYRKSNNDSVPVIPDHEMHVNGALDTTGDDPVNTTDSSIHL